jgi:hypothetical protein
MDDGSYKSIYYILHTQGFGIECQELLIKAFKNLYNINLRIYKDRDYRYLKIDNDSTDVFANLIKPYILPLFIYKLEAIGDRYKK